MLILHVVENLDDRYGGPAKSVPFLVKHLSFLGVKSCLLSVKEYKNEQNTVIEQNNLQWKSCEAVGPRKLYFSPELKQSLERILKDNSDVIIHVHNSWTYPTLLALQLSKKYGCPLVVSVRGSMYPWSLQRSRLKKKIVWALFQKRCLTEASIIHATEINEARAIRGLGIYTQICIIPNGIEISSNKELPHRDQATAFLGLRREKKYLLFLSRIHPKKGLHLLVNAFLELAESYPDWDLLVVGPNSDEKYASDIKSEVIQTPHRDRVLFTGFLEGYAKLCAYASSDLFVLPSFTENFGISIAEAILFNLPVITTTATPWREIEEFQSGWFIDLSYQNLKKALEEAMRMDDYGLKKKGALGANFIHRYDWQTQASKMKGIYEYLQGKQQRPNEVITQIDNA